MLHAKYNTNENGGVGEDFVEIFAVVATSLRVFRARSPMSRKSKWTFARGGVLTYHPCATPDIRYVFKPQSKCQWPRYLAKKHTHTYTRLLIIRDYSVTTATQLAWDQPCRIVR